MSCSCASDAGQVILVGAGGISVTGSGTPTDPYRASAGQDNDSSIQLEVRDSSTVNMSIFGSGTTADPYVVSADTASASSLRGLGDVYGANIMAPGQVPIWIGSASSGRFEFRTPGTRYTTSSTRGPGLFQGEQIKETDTGKRYEWDGSQYVSLDVALPTATDFTTALVSRGTVAPSTDWNTLAQAPGIYRIQTWEAGKNTPPGAYNFGTLVVFVSGLSVTQRYSAHSSGFEYVRTKWNESDWTSWARLYSSSEGDALANRATALESRATTLENTSTRSVQRITTLENNSGVTLQTGTVGYGSGVRPNQGVDLTRYGIHAILRFNLYFDTYKRTGEGIIQMPEGFRPRNFSADGMAHNGIDDWGVAIDTDGWLRLRTHDQGGGGLWGTIPYQTQ